MGGCVTKEQDIARAQYLDLAYSQSGTLYELLPNAPRPSFDPVALKSPVVPHVDGVIGSISQDPAKTSSKQKSILNATPNNSSRNPPGPGKTLEVHAIQFTAMDKSLKGKKKEKAKLKSMPRNKVLPNRLLANLHNGNLSIPTSFARRITILRIVHDYPRSVAFSKGPLLSLKSRFHLSKLRW